jgi:hypothetical protein
MAYRTNYSVSECAGGCGTRPAKGTITDLNREWATAHGWRCEPCRRERRASISERKKTVAAHKRQQARITAEAEFRARFDAEAYQSDLMVLPDDSGSPMGGCADQLGRHPAHIRSRGC